MEEKKKTVLSGIQPSGNLTIGNYLGALRQWAKMQDQYISLYMVANQHAITVRQDSSELRKRSMEAYALIMACGIDPSKSIIFIQSHVPEHAQLNWVLACTTYMGELNRMTQFKDKSAKHADNINAGLYTYPVLMASDILLYQADYVPVGADQKQHVELTRDIAERFNKLYGNTFVIPEPFIPKFGAKIMSLQEPDKKMSKSDANPNASIFLMDDPDTVVRKIKRSVTDCEATIAYDPASRPGVSNLLTIYATCLNKTMEETLKTFEGKGYGDLKAGVADAVLSVLEPIHADYKRYLQDKAYMIECMKNGAEKASMIASKTIRKVYHKVGFDTGLK
ncbi:MAG: tryptophan--tRNA ligase [Clostridia bacterium]|nr:tryptophan--tRNA ligase [Clostridia bacterium]